MTEIFNLLIVFLINNTLLFVRIKQTSKTEVRKQPFKCVPSSRCSQGKLKVGKSLEKKLFGKIVGCRSANFRKGNSFTDTLQEFY